MLNSLDWILLSRNGYELFATLKLLEQHSDLIPKEEAIGPPHSATAALCRRCWVYPGIVHHRSHFCCPTCRWILFYAKRYGQWGSNSTAVWGVVEPIPQRLREKASFYRQSSVACYVHDDRRFLLLMPKTQLKAWIEDILLYQPDMRGHLSVFPPRSSSQCQIGDVLSNILYHTPQRPSDHLWVQFYSNGLEVLQASRLKPSRIPIYDIGTFKGWLEAAAVFRSLLKPHVQRMLFDLLLLKNDWEKRFHWGRLLNLLKPEAIDMIESWRIRQWPKAQVKRFYHLMHHVEYYSTNSDDPLSAGSADQ